MHYIRLLRAPKLVIKKKICSINVLVTVSTDLGDDFLAIDLKLYALLIRGREVLALEEAQWRPGLRALSIDISSVDRSMLKTPVTIVVSPTWDPDKAIIHLSLDHLPPVMSVWSDSFTQDTLGTQTGFQRHLVAASDAVLRIHEDPGDSIARHLCLAANRMYTAYDYADDHRDGGLGFCSLLRNLTFRPDQIKRDSILALRLKELREKKVDVIELGSGTGAAGIQLAHTGIKGQVILTDLPSAMDILHRNIAASPAPKLATLDACALDWAADMSASIKNRSFGLIVVSDCTYNTDSIPALVNTLDALMKQCPTALTVIATKVRHDSESVFRDQLLERNILEVERYALTLPDVQRAAFGQELEQVDVYVYKRG